MPTVRQAIQFGEPVGSRPHRFKTELPDHADMLRYDIAFCNPEDISMVVFPVFKTRNGKLGGNITSARWSSFSIKLRSVEDFHIPNIGQWITYQHITPGEPLKLTRLTLDEYIERHKQDKMKLWGFA